MRPISNKVQRGLLTLWWWMFVFGLVAAFATATEASRQAADVPEGGNKLRVKIAPAVTIAGERLVLADLAQLEGNQYLRTQIGDLDLGRAPKPGMVKRLSGKWIASKINSRIRGAEQIQMNIPNYVAVQRAHQSLPHEQLRAFFEQWVASGLDGADFSLRRFKARGLTKLPVGKVSFKPEQHPQGALAGAVSMRADVLVDGQTCGRVYLYGWIDRSVQVVCAARPIPRGTVIGPDDVRLATRNLSRVSANWIQSTQAVFGLRALRSFSQGQSIARNMLEAPALVNAGDRVKLVVRDGLLRVETIGKVKSKGAMGDQVKVENLSSGKTVIGRVADATTVEILF